MSQVTKSTDLSLIRTPDRGPVQSRHSKKTLRAVTDMLAPVIPCLAGVVLVCLVSVTIMAQTKGATSTPSGRTATQAKKAAPTKSMGRPGGSSSSKSTQAAKSEMTAQQRAAEAAADAAEVARAAEIAARPIFVTVNIFQLQINAGENPDLSDQVFRMKSSSLSDYEKWVKAFGKTYPGVEASLLKMEPRRVFRTSKPTIVSVSRQVDGRSMVLEINGAQSPGDGETPGTSLVALLNLQFGNDEVSKPISYSITPMEVEHGMTYFYLVKSLKLNATDYARFLRPNATPDSFPGKTFYIVVAISVDLDETAAPTRYFDERQSVQLQEQASKKVALTLPESIQKSKLAGMVRVKVDISPEGKVTKANIAYSTLPEANQEAITAARQWEFPASLFATDQNPITGFLSFNVDKRPD